MKALFPPSLAALMLVTPLASASLGAQSDEDPGLQLIREVDARARGYGDFESRLVMRIRNGDSERVREMVVRGIESGDGERTRIILERPTDLAGTEFLSASGSEGERAQWIYLPAARRVRRIAGSQSDDAFLGSHFTYDDMTPPEVGGFEYRWVRDQDEDGRSVALVERARRSEGADGSKQLLRIDRERAILLGVTFFDPDGQRVRELELADYLDVGGFWRSTRMTMTDVTDGSHTSLEWSDVRIGVGLRRSDFESSRLGR